MEVHSHTHSPGKKWTHYFWEFFMLFLAVTLGFFVENQREHMVEQQREKQYMKSMMEDLSSGSLRLVRNIGVSNSIMAYDQNQIKRAEELNMQATELIERIKKEYHLE